MAANLDRAETSLTAVSDVAYIRAIDSSGNSVRISKADLASVLGGYNNDYCSKSYKLAAYGGVHVISITLQHYDVVEIESFNGSVGVQRDYVVCCRTYSGGMIYKSSVHTTNAKYYSSGNTIYIEHVGGQSILTKISSFSSVLNSIFTLDSVPSGATEITFSDL